MLFKWRDQNGREHEFHLVDKVSSKWTTFGSLLNFEQNQLDALQMDFPHDTSRRWQKVMGHWIETGGRGCRYPVTWDGLCSMLEDVKCFQVAKDLKRALAFASDETSAQLHRHSRLCPQLTFTLSSATILILVALVAVLLSIILD